MTITTAEISRGLLWADTIDTDPEARHRLANLLIEHGPELLRMAQRVASEPMIIATNEDIAWLASMIVETERCLKARLQAEETWMVDNPEAWKSVGCKLTKAGRIAVAEKERRIAGKYQHDLECLRRLLASTRAASEQTSGPCLACRQEAAIERGETVPAIEYQHTCRKELEVTSNPEEDFHYEAACSGLRYKSPDGCGEVSAIWIGGKRWPIAMEEPESEPPAISPDVLDELERMNRYCDDVHGGYFESPLKCELLGKLIAIARRASESTDLDAARARVAELESQLAEMLPPSGVIVMSTPEEWQAYGAGRDSMKEELTTTQQRVAGLERLLEKFSNALGEAAGGYPFSAELWESIGEARRLARKET